MIPSMNIGVLAADGIEVGLVQDHKLVGKIHSSEGVQSFPSLEIVQILRERIEQACKANSVKLEDLESIGIGVAGIVRDGVIEESPNIPQMKGLKVREALEAVGLRNVHVLNDADAMAAGIAATRGALEKLVRVWTLGHGVGYGRYPQSDGPGEGGHTVISLDPKEHFCGCGGKGHLEGIVGNRSIRLRFLDLEPEEVFASKDERCTTFIKTWHRALAAATATSVHIEGCGKFYISGLNAPHVDTDRLLRYLHEMVKMTPLQGSVFEIIHTTAELAIIGACVESAHGR
jgi:glucokinase